MASQGFHYEVIEEYVRGGCSVIYKIRDLNPDALDKHLVLKTMVANKEDPHSHVRFLQEYEFLSAYPHPNIVEVAEFYDDWQGNPAYVMEWVEGGTWQTYWEDQEIFEDPDNFAFIFKQLCEVLDFIHANNIVHCDLKPQNILITPERKVKLIDFGIMKGQDEFTLYTKRNFFLGSAYYVAPESISEKDVTHAVDIFALGVMLYKLITGMQPYNGRTLAETVFQRLGKPPQAPSQIRDLPPEMDVFIFRILNKEPAKRHQSCQDVYDDFYPLLQAAAEHSHKIREGRRIDIISKEPLLHSEFIEECRDLIRENKCLGLIGTTGSGKRTILTNLGFYLARDNRINIDCHPELNQLDFMEILVEGLPKSIQTRDELKPWLEMLGTALPRLNLAKPSTTQTVHSSSLLSAFLRVLGAVEAPMSMIISDVQDTSEELRQFLVHLVHFVKSSSNRFIYLLFTTNEEVAGLFEMAPNRIVPFPSPLALTEFLAMRFGNCCVSMDLTEELVHISGRNLSRFILLIRKYQLTGKLAVTDGELMLQTVSGGEKTVDPDVAKAEMLGAFSARQLSRLEWLALCPDGLDLSILQHVTEGDPQNLTKTLMKADSLDLIHFHSGSTEGVRWVNQGVRRFLIDSLPPEERQGRFSRLAQAIEHESSRFLDSSPPLWQMLATLYLDADEEEKAFKYAMTYAEYHFRNGGYAKIPNVLTPFLKSGCAKPNHRFWSMLAMASTERDPNRALEYANRALLLSEDVQALTLMSILEFQAGNFEKSGIYLDRVMKTNDFKNIDILFGAKLIPILVSMGKHGEAASLFAAMTEHMKERNDPATINAMILAKVHLQEKNPKEVIKLVNSVQGDLQPRTAKELNNLVFFSYQETFRYQEALGCLRQIEAFSDPAYQFANLLFLNLNFHQYQEVAEVFSRFEFAKKQYQLDHLESLFDIAEKLVAKTPDVYDMKWLSKKLEPAGVNKHNWLTLIANHLDLRLIKTAFLRQLLESMKISAPIWSQHQMPRWWVWLAYKERRYDKLSALISGAVKHVLTFDLEMEKLRLHCLMSFLADEGAMKGTSPFQGGFQPTKEVQTFLATQPFGDFSLDGME